MSELTRCLRDGRRRRRLTQPDVAKMAKISRTDYIKLESDIFTYLAPESLERIATVTAMDPVILRSLYYAEFRQELREQKREALSDSPKAKPKEELAETSVSPNAELKALFHSILSLPDDQKDYMARTIRMVMQNVMTGAA